MEQALEEPIVFARMIGVSCEFVWRFWVILLELSFEAAHPHHRHPTVTVASGNACL